MRRTIIPEQQAFDIDPMIRRTKFEVLIDTLNHLQAAVWAMLGAIIFLGLWIISELRNWADAALKACS